MAGILTKGITLSYSTTGTDYTVLTNLQEIPEIGNGEKEMIDVTVLTDDVKKSIAGLGDSAQTLAFKFLYVKEQFDTLVALEGSIGWQVKLPDNTTCSFTGTSSVKLDSVGVNAPLTYTVAVKPDSEMIWG